MAYGSHVGPGYVSSMYLRSAFLSYMAVTLALDIPRRNSVKGWRSHVELDIPRRSSLKGWPSHVELDIPRRSSLKCIWQSRWAGYTS